MKFFDKNILMTEKTHLTYSPSSSFRKSLVVTDELESQFFVPSEVMWLSDDMCGVRIRILIPAYKKGIDNIRKNIDMGAYTAVDFGG